MTPREVAELTLAGRRAARRVGKEFVLDFGKLGRLGLVPSDCYRIEAVVDSIERHVEAELASLETTQWQG